MLRRIDAAEGEKVFELMSKVYSNHSFLHQGLDPYKKLLSEGAYVSLGDFDEDDRLQAHAGYRLGKSFNVINALVVDPDKRGHSLGKLIFSARLEYIEDKDPRDFIVGYSMMQHSLSQRLYPDSFKPIGLDIGYPNIYHNADSKYNQGERGNAEIVLCQNTSNCTPNLELSIPAKGLSMATRIMESLGVSCQLSEAPSVDDSVFLGFHPDVNEGLFVPAYLDRSTTVEFAHLATSNEEREIFVNSVRESYERTTNG